MANLDNIKKLILALRSGKYKQVRGRLRQGDCFCAEAVALDITGGEWDGNFYIHSKTKLPWEFVAPQSDLFPAFDQKLLVKLSDGTVVSMLSANDGLAMSFSDIADGLERYYLND